MSRYPDGMRRITVAVDLNGRDHTVTYDVPAEWATWPDGHRQTWAGDRCDAAVALFVGSSWSDADAVDGPSWDADGDPVG